MVFSLPVSAAACERNWSVYGFIHNKLRNKLSDERAQRLVYVYCNLRELEKKRKRDVQDDVSEDEDAVDFPDFMKETEENNFD
jgi:hypothetical protein